MPELPLSHVSLGTPGAVWPRNSSYNTFFSDPKLKKEAQNATNKAFDDDELDAQILEAIDLILGEVSDPKEKPHSQNSDPTIYEVEGEEEKSQQ